MKNYGKLLAGLGILLFGMVMVTFIGCPGGGSPSTKYWTVSFDLNGGTVDEAETLADVRVANGSSLGSQYPNPTRAGSWSFGGWFDESAEPSVEYRSNTPITNDLSLKARWTNTDDNKWQVTFDTNGGTPSSIADIQVTKGQPMGDAYPDEPEKDDYTFEGWYLASDTEFSGTKYEAHTPAIEADTNLKAKWKSTNITIVIDEIDNEDTDSVTATPASGKAGDEITLNYTLADTKTNNRLVFSGLTADIGEVDEAGTGTKTYTITEDDATDGVITIIATFSHSDKTSDTIAFGDTSGVTKTYGDASYTKAISTTGSGTGAITYSSGTPSVATVNSSTGAVTILKVGSTTITATKAEDETYARTTASYLLTVEKLQLTIEAPTVITKVYNGDTTVTFTPGALTNKVGSDAVTVSAIGTFASAGVGTNINVTVVYSISGAGAGNYTAPVEGTATGSITKADGRTVSVPTVASKTDTSITVSAVTVSTPDYEQTAEYTISTAAPLAETETWQDGLTFSGLTDSTDYYVFARSKGNANCNAGTAQVSAKITTNAPPPILKYDFGAGDTVKAGYPTYTGSTGGTFTGAIGTSAATANSVSNFAGKRVLTITRTGSGGDPKFTLPFNLGTETLADFNAIILVARGVSGAVNNQTMIAHVDTSTVLGQTVTNGFNFTNNNTGAVSGSSVLIPITLATANNYTGAVDIGFVINNQGAAVYEILSVELVKLPSSILKYNFGAGDTIDSHYPTYTDVGTASGNSFTAAIDTSNATGGNFQGKTILRVSKNYNSNSPKYILPFNLGSKTLADFSAILIVARGAGTGTDHGSKELRAQLGTSTTQIGISSSQTATNGFSLDNNATNTATNGVIIPITIANPNTYTGLIEIGFVINNVNQLNYEILSVTLMPSSSLPGYNFADNTTTLDSEYPKLGYSSSTATISGSVSNNTLTVNKTGSNNTVSFLLPFDIGSDNLSDYVGVYIKLRGASTNGGDYTNKGINVYLNTGSTTIGAAGNVGLSTTYQLKFVPLTSARDFDGASGNAIIGIGLGQTNPYILEIESVFLVK